MNLTPDVLAEARKRVANARGGPDGLVFGSDGVPTPAFVLALLDRIEELQAEIAERDSAAMERGEKD